LSPSNEDSSRGTSSPCAASGYAIYLENSRTVADWIDLQILISQENQELLSTESLENIKKEKGTAIFKTLEEAENALRALEKSF
jgi:hypothetical protein